MTHDLIGATVLFYSASRWWWDDGTPKSILWHPPVAAIVTGHDLTTNTFDITCFPPRGTPYLEQDVRLHLGPEDTSEDWLTARGVEGHHDPGYIRVRP